MSRSTGGASFTSYALRSSGYSAMSLPTQAARSPGATQAEVSNDVWIHQPAARARTHPGTCSAV